jgi:hypothetical protein
MRRAWIALLVLAGCASEESSPEPPPRALSPEQAAQVADASGPSAARDHPELERWNGQEVTLYGIFGHDRARHGIVILKSGLRVTILHFDQHRSGDDWFKYLGKPCSVTGILHTYTRNIEGYHGPTLELRSGSDFSGTTE